jgi:structure-specific recognition protein 1
MNITQTKSKDEDSSDSSSSEYTPNKNDTTKKHSSSDDSSDESRAKNPKKKKNKKNDPNAPKRAKSAFMYFSAEKRSEIKATNPKMKFGEIQKVIGAAWKEQTTTEMKKWDDMAMNDKERYRQEFIVYRNPSIRDPPSDNDKNKQDLGAQNDQSSEPNKVSKFGNFSELEKFPELLLNDLQNIST